MEWWQGEGPLVITGHCAQGFWSHSHYNLKPCDSADQWTRLFMSKKRWLFFFFFLLQVVVTIQQWSQTQFLEGHSSAQFSSNPNQGAAETVLLCHHWIRPLHVNNCLVQLSCQIWPQKTTEGSPDCWANHWYNPPYSPRTVLIQSEQKGW